MNLNTHPENSAKTPNEPLITNIDSQHRKITELFHKLLNLKSHKVDFKAVSEILNELNECMILHFETEENLMRIAGVKDIEKHIQQHDFFKVKLGEFREKAETESGFLNNLNYELSVNFLKNWLFMHMNMFYIQHVGVVEQHIPTSGDSQDDS